MLLSGLSSLAPPPPSPSLSMCIRRQSFQLNSFANWDTFLSLIGPYFRIFPPSLPHFQTPPLFSHSWMLTFCPIKCSIFQPPIFYLISHSRLCFPLPYKGKLSLEPYYLSHTEISSTSVRGKRQCSGWQVTFPIDIYALWLFPFHVLPLHPI